MLLIKNKDGAYEISYRGNAYDSFARDLSSIRPLRFISGSWRTDKNGADSLSVKNDIPLFSSIGSGLKLTPFEYQKESIFESLSVGSGCLVTAPCGAGKTPIGIGLYDELKRSGKISGRALIVVKASIKIQWPKEINKFSSYSSGVLNTYAYMTAKYKPRIDRAKKKNDASLIESLQKEAADTFNKQFEPDILVANYETLKDAAVLKTLLSKRTNIEFIYADEVHVIKSPTADRSRALYKFSKIPYRFGATATPIQKNPVDVFSIFKFLRPDLFPTLTEFRKRFVRYNAWGFPCGAKNEHVLNRIINPYMVIKTQDEVSRELPELQVIPQYCSLTEKQLKKHELLMNEIREIKETQQSIVAKYGSLEVARQKSKQLVELDAQILTRQTFAQELADTEDLLKNSSSRIAKQYLTGSSSSKIALMLDLMENIFDQNEKVAVFSKYKSLQPILDVAICRKFGKIDIAHVHSGISGEARYKEIYTRFQETDSCNVLLMSDAAAEGSNLYKVSYLIEFEPADSFLLQTQRRGRIVRASSTHKTVYVYQLIAEDSYDEIALKIVNKKEGFMRNIIESDVQTDVAEEA